MSNFLFSGRPTRKSGSRQPNENESICIGCSNTFHINTLRKNDGKRCLRCFDKHMYSKGVNVYSDPNKYGFYRMNKDVDHDVVDSEIISDTEDLADETDEENEVKNDDNDHNEESEEEEDDESEDEDDESEEEDEEDEDEDEDEESEEDEESDTEYDGDNLTKMEKAIEQAPKRRRIH